MNLQYLLPKHIPVGLRLPDVPLEEFAAQAVIPVAEKFALEAGI